MKASSFTRRGVADQQQGPGTMPGLHGVTLLSSGCASLDRLLSGGLPAGSLTLVGEDGVSNCHYTLVKLFLAEGIAVGQNLLWASARIPEGSAGQALPREAKDPRAGAKKEEAGNAEQVEEEGTQLRIAWQYERYIRQQQQQAGGPLGSAASLLRSSGGGAMPGAAGTRGPSGRRTVSSRPTLHSAAAAMRDWCHQFDLARPIGDEAISSSRLQVREYAAPAAAGRTDKPQLAAAGAAGLGAASATAAARPQQHPFAVLAEDVERFAASLSPPTGNSSSSSPGGLAGSGSSAPGSGAPGPLPAAAATAAVPGAARRDPSSIGRIAVLSLGGPGWRQGITRSSSSSSATAHAGQLEGGGDAGWRHRCSSSFAAYEEQQEGGGGGAELLRALFRIKAAVRRCGSCAALVTLPQGLLGGSLGQRALHMADVALVMEPLADDSALMQLLPDATSCCGLMRVVKLSGMHSLAPPPPDAPLYVLRHRRRRLAIDPVEIDPEKEMAEAAAAEIDGGHGGGAAKGAAGCHGPPGGTKAEQFEF